MIYKLYGHYLHISGIIMGEVKRDYPTSYFYKPIQYLIWGGVAIYDIKNPNLNLIHKINSAFLLGIFGYGYIVTELIHVYKHFNEVEELTLTMCYLIAHFIAIGKIIVFTVQKERIGKFISSLEEGVFKPDISRGGEEENRIIDAAVSRTHTQAKIFGLAVVSMLSSRVIPCLMKTTETFYDPHQNTTKIIVIFPYPSTLPFPINSKESPYYEFEFFYQTFSIALFGWYLGTSDTIITGLLIHAKAQFMIVTNAVLTVVERAERMSHQTIEELIKPAQYDQMMVNGNMVEYEIIEKYNDILASKLNHCMKDCIKHHHAIIQLIDDMEETFSLILLIQFLGSLTSLCVGLYQTSLMDLSNPSFISMSSFTMAMLFQLLIYCWNGNEVSLYSLKVGEAAFNSKWLQADNSVKTSLILMILRSQRSSHLTAGKFSKLSLETFTTILRGSVSYFMVLRKVNEDVEM